MWVRHQQSQHVQQLPVMHSHDQMMQNDLLHT